MKKFTNLATYNSIQNWCVMLSFGKVSSIWRKNFGIDEKYFASCNFFSKLELPSAFLTLIRCVLDHTDQSGLVFLKKLFDCNVIDHGSSFWPPETFRNVMKENTSKKLNVVRANHSLSSILHNFFYCLCVHKWHWFEINVTGFPISEQRKQVFERFFRKFYWITLKFYILNVCRQLPGLQTVFFDQRQQKNTQSSGPLGDFVNFSPSYREWNLKFVEEMKFQLKLYVFGTLSSSTIHSKKHIISRRKKR